jgi:hypothetical protein
MAKAAGATNAIPSQVQASAAKAAPTRRMWRMGLMAISFGS